MRATIWNLIPYNEHSHCYVRVHSFILNSEWIFNLCMILNIVHWCLNARALHRALPSYGVFFYHWHISLYNIKNHHHHTSHQKNVEVLGSSQVHWWWYTFSKLLFFGWKFKVAANTSNYFPWNDRLTSFIFEKMSTRNATLTTQSLSISCSFK